MSKLKIDNKEVEKGDWIVVECDGWSESGCVVDVNDGKEGWSIERGDIVKVSWK